MPEPSIAEILRSARTIAVVGCSPRPSQTSHYIAVYLQRAGYEVIPVNPHHTELLGVPCYPSLTDIPPDVEIDIVNVYRRPQFTAQVVVDAAERAASTRNKPVVWTQLGVSSPEAETLAIEHRLAYVRERCIMVEHGIV
jgi:uncharacterized protein